MFSLQKTWKGKAHDRRQEPEMDYACICLPCTFFFQNFVLVEFGTVESKLKAMEISCDSKDPQSIPAFTPAVYFQTPSQNRKMISLPDCTEETQSNEGKALKELKDLRSAKSVGILLKLRITFS